MTREEALEVLRFEWYQHEDGSLVEQAIEKAFEALKEPPVVRCKDCTSFGLWGCTGVGYCRHDDGLVDPKPDDFCSYGERKVGE